MLFKAESLVSSPGCSIHTYNEVENPDYIGQGSVLLYYYIEYANEVVTLVVLMENIEHETQLLRLA